MNALHNHHECPHHKRASLTKAVEEDLGHWLSNWATKEILYIGSHAESKGDSDGWKLKNVWLGE